jgi:competence protein ComEC
MEESSKSSYALDNILISVVLGFSLGVIFDVLFRFEYDIITISFLGIVIFVSGLKYKIRHIFLCISIVFFSMLLGIVRMEFSHPGVSSLESSINQKVTLVGVIDTPIEKIYNIQSKLSLSDSQTILISTAKYPRLSYGDKISVTGKLTKPKNFLTDQGTEFDYVSYLYKDDIKYILQNGRATIISHDNGNSILSPLLAIKNWFIKGYRRILSPDEADLMGGLTLGTKQNISKEFRNSLVVTSTVHIIALSGYNVTIVANFLRTLLSHIPFLGSRGALAGGGLGIILFVLMTGAQSSAIRAGIMALVALLGRGTGRTYDAFRALILAGFIMILWNPKFLVYDVSFQLSFLATLGMIFLTPIFLNAFKRVPENIFKYISLREMLATTLGAQVSVLPFIIYKMGVLSLIALPANIMILPAIPFAMGIGSLAGIIGNFSTTVATPFAFVTHLLLQYIMILINFFAQIPFAYVSLKGVSVFICLGLYTLLVFWAYKKRDIFYEK